MQNPVMLGHPEEKRGGNLEGLRMLLDDWNSGRGPDRERDEKVAKARQDAAQAHIYSSYLKQAEQEDRDFLERWTETSNIILVFSGLQSAIVVAFIIFAETSLGDPGTTGSLLQSRTDNSTMIQSDSQLLSDQSSISVRISACWYTSFACSLLSAFGGLLSKQWAMHYAGQPLWANTATLHCHLREMRHDGLGRWKLGWLMDSLISLLQLSVLAFAIGLILHLHKTSRAHFVILLSFTCLGAAFFAITLIAGAFVPGCPFKSSVTESLYRISLFLVLALPASLLSILLGILRIFAVIFDAKKVSRWTSRAIAWCEIRIGRGDKALASGDIEARAVGHNRAGATGIVCWWLLQEDSQCTGHNVEINRIVEEVALLPPREVISQFTRKQSFTFWSSKVLGNLQSVAISPSPYQNYHLQMGDILCDLMDRSWWGCMLALRASENGGSNPPGEFCAIIRGAWCKARQTDVLPIPVMRWTTVSLYFQLQLRSWAPLWEKGDGLDRNELQQELLVLLDDPRLVNNGQEISNAAALAALVLVDKDGRIGQNHRVYRLPIQSGAERLLQALHLLSDYPTDNPPSMLILSVVRISAYRILGYLDYDESSLTKAHCWKNGDIAGTLLRFLRLGHLWRNQEVLESAALGEGITREVQRVISRVITYLITTKPAAGWYILSSAEGLTTVLETYAHPSTISPINLDALRIIDFVLGLRYHHAPGRVTLYVPWIKEDTPSISPYILLPNVLTSHPHILTQLICDIERSHPLSYERRIILSALVKGRDIFFAGNESLQEVLHPAGVFMMQSNSLLLPIGNTHFPTFNYWNDIVAGLRQQVQECTRRTENRAVILGSEPPDRLNSGFLDV